MSERTMESEAERLMSEATRQTDLTDFGDSHFHAPYRALLRSYDQDARLHELGREASERECVHLLANRLRIQHDLTRDPEISNSPVLPPIFITGMPRTGSTLTHRLLAQDPLNRALLGWELRFPSQTLRRGLEQSNAQRVVAAEQYWREINRRAPEIEKKHTYSAHQPEECNQLFQHSFVSRIFYLWAGVISYTNYISQMDKRPIFRHYRTQLQLLQANRPTQSERWVLKSPTHLYDLETLFEVFPDARVIHCHRDPAEVLPSACSFLRTCRATRSDYYDDESAVSYFLNERAELIDRAIDARERLPDSRFYDLYYDDLIDDPYKALRSIYGYFSLPAGEGFDDAVAAELKGSRLEKQKAGAHQYSLANHGIDADLVRAKLSRYYERFFPG